jgi:hypothetical protein
MKWQCALLQRWLPEYPDGNLPGWVKRWLQSHLTRCVACRQELAQLRKVVAAIEATPVADPGPEFWRDFSRDMHLKLVQAAQTDQAAPVSAGPRRFRLPYLVGAPALAVLLLYVVVHLTGSATPIQDQALVKPESPAKMATVPQPAPPAAVPATPILPMEKFVNVAVEEGAPLPVEEVDISGWDLDAELSAMTEQEKNAFLKKMRQRKKDGSCIGRLSYCSWG